MIYVVYSSWNMITEILYTMCHALYVTLHNIVDIYIYIYVCMHVCGVIVICYILQVIQVAVAHMIASFAYVFGQVLPCGELDQTNVSRLAVGRSENGSHQGVPYMNLLFSV